MYLILNIFTQFYNVSDSGSNEIYMLEGLNRVKNIFLRHGYSRHLLDQKMKLFLNYQKPDKPEIHATLCLKYTCANTENYCKQLINKMKNWIPVFNINIAFKGVYDSDLIRALEALQMLQIDTGDN